MLVTKPLVPTDVATVPDLVVTTGAVMRFTPFCCSSALPNSTGCGFITAEGEAGVVATVPE